MNCYHHWKSIIQKFSTSELLIINEIMEQTTENVHEESVDYNKFYSKFIQKALDTIRKKFDLIQHHIGNGLFHWHIEKIRIMNEYIDMLQRIFTLVQQIEVKDKRKKKND